MVVMRRSLSVLSAAAFLLSGCGLQNDAVEDNSTETELESNSLGPDGLYTPAAELSELSVVWSAAPGIDLFDEYSMLVRAAVESDTVLIFARNRQGYPGYMDALSDFALNATQERWTGTPPEAVGTYRNSIMEINETEEGFTAFFCNLRSEVGWITKDQEKIEHGNPEFKLTKHPAGPAMLTFKRKPPLDVDPPVSQLRQQRNPTVSDSDSSWSAPTENLFDGWMDVQADWYQEGRQQCRDWSYTVDPTIPLEEPWDFYTNERPPTLPAYPGW